MYLPFGFNPETNLYHIFRSLNLISFASTFTKAYRHCVSCQNNFSYNFTHIFLNFASVLTTSDDVHVICM